MLGMFSIIEACRTISASPWKTVSGLSAAAVSAGFLLLCYGLRTSADGFSFLHYVNLAFHEAGHPIFGMFGPTSALYGGTVAQLLLPAIVAASFWRQRDARGFAVAGIWFFENFLNIARYMGDARAQVLPLVGGGEHDWTEIFSRWGLLTADSQIAGMVSTAGWLGMLLVWAWLLGRWRNDQGGQKSEGVSRSPV
jgi:hypothetical protein